MKLGLDKLQLVIYTNALDLSNKLQIAQGLQDIKSIKLDKDPNIVSLPDGAPMEIPRIMLSSKDNTYVINVSLSRVDIIYRPLGVTANGVPIAQLESSKNTLGKIYVEVFALLKNQYSARVGRAAVVATFLVKLKESSKEFLKQILLGKLSGAPEEIRLGLLYDESLGAFKVNKWRRYETLRNKTNLKDDTAMGLMIDINTPAEIDYGFDDKKIAEFYNLASRSVQDELDNLHSQEKE